MIIKDNFLQFFIKAYVVGTHLNRLGETILLSTHNISFYGEIMNIIPKLSSNTLLICFTAEGGTRVWTETKTTNYGINMKIQQNIYSGTKFICFYSTSNTSWMFSEGFNFISWVIVFFSILHTPSSSHTNRSKVKVTGTLSRVASPTFNCVNVCSASWERSPLIFWGFKMDLNCSSAKNFFKHLS